MCVVCVCVLACVCSCAHASVRNCRWFVRSWLLSFSVFVCLLVCVGGGGVACIDVWVKVSLCVSVCECVIAFFGFWLPRFVCVCGFVNVCTRRCVCVCVCVLQLLFWMLLLVLVLCGIGFDCVCITLCLWLQMQVWLCLCLWLWFSPCMRLLLWPLWWLSLWVW